MNLQSLKENRASIVAQMSTLLNTAKAEQRDMSGEENENWVKLDGEQEKLANEIAMLEKEERANLLSQEIESKKTVTPFVTRQARAELNKRQASELLRSWALGGKHNYDVLSRASEVGFDLSNNVLEYRALSVGSNSAGGYTVPTSFSDELDKQLAWYFTVSDAVDSFASDDGTNFPYPTVNDTSNASSIVTEASGVGSSTDPTFGQVTFKCFDYYSPIVKISNQLLRDSRQDIPAVLAELFAERMGRALDVACVSINAGSSAPEGLLYGVSAGVNLASGNAITIAKLFDLESSVDRAYRNVPGTGFLMHDATWQAVRQLADTTNRPLINIDLQNSVQPKLLGYPVFISNNMTSIGSPGDNQPLILFGALKKYKIRFCGGSTLSKLVELYAGNGQVGFVLHQAWDARWVTKSGVKTLNSYDAP